jgi:hypothetical protein
MYVCIIIIILHGMDTYWGRGGGKWKKEISLQISGPDNSVN